MLYNYCKYKNREPNCKTCVPITQKNKITQVPFQSLAHLFNFSGIHNTLPKHRVSLHWDLNTVGL